MLLYCADSYFASQDLGGGRLTSTASWPEPANNPTDRVQSEEQDKFVADAAARAAAGRGILPQIVAYRVKHYGPSRSPAWSSW